MRQRQISLVAISILMGCAGVAQGDERVLVRPSDRHAVIVADGGQLGLGAGLQQGTLLAGTDGQTYLGIWVQAPELRGRADRPPMALSLVIDRSGSMSGDKIANARAAAQSFIAGLRDNDILSVFAYDDSIMQVYGPGTLSGFNRQTAMSRVAELIPGGSTNIYGGLMAAQQALASAPASHPLRRTILISDGLANVGPSSPEELATVSARGTEWGIQVTTIGVGLDYDERLMAAVAMRSAGRFYHLAEPAQMASILSAELNLMARTVASRTLLEIIPAPGIEILGAEGIDVEHRQGHVVLPLGAMHSAQRREILLRVRADTARPGQRSLGEVRLRYADPDGGNERSRAVQLSYQVSSSPEEVHRSVDDRVATLVQTFRAAQTQREAAQMLSRGNAAGAASALSQQARQMRSQAATLAAPARAEVEGRARRLDEQSARTRSAPAAPAAQRGLALDFEDDALETMGY